MRPVDWLLQRGGGCQSPRELMRDSAGLTYQGFPLLWVTAFVMTLHPQTRGVSMTWWRDKPDPSETTVLRGIEHGPSSSEARSPRSSRQARSAAASTCQLSSITRSWKT